MLPWHLYILRCCDGSLYTGITTDVKRRILEHNGEGKKGAKYLRGKGPATLVFKKRIGGKSLASKAEYRVKRLSKTKKEMLVLKKIRLKEILMKGTENEKGIRPSHPR